jgi:hypothetical protein
MAANVFDRATREGLVLSPQITDRIGYVFFS